MKNCCRLLALFFLGVTPLFGASLDNGVDPFNLGKGDWIWEMPQTETALGVANVQAVINYEKAQGMQWITVKCGDGGGIWSQFDADTVTRCHAAGMKIFGWAYAYGNNVQGEINVALNALNLGADGIIIDAEAEYETNAFNNAKAIKYCQAIKQQYPNRLLAHGPSPSVHFHPGFPYLEFGSYVDVTMPQDYWGYRGFTPAQVLALMDTEYRTNLYNVWTGSATNAIKPICPVAQADQPTVAGSDETDFVNLVLADPTPLTSAGYHGISFWDTQEHTASQALNISNATVTLMTSVAPKIPWPPINRCVDQGGNASFSVTAYGSATLAYQWCLGGTNLNGATNVSYTVTNAQPTNAGNYTVVISNAFGVVTSRVAVLTVITPFPFLQPVFSDDFQTNSSARWSLFQGSANNVSDFTASWAYDYTNQTYSAYGLTSLPTTTTIPIAPSTTNGSKVGLKLTVNKNDATASASGISLYPAGIGAVSNCVLRFDAWINYAGGPNGETASGTTEMMTCGLNHTGTRVNWLDVGTATTSDGTWFAVDGEGGTGSPSVATSYSPGSDYRAFKGNGASGPTHLTFPTGGLGINGAQSEDVVDRVYRDLFGYPNYESPGTPGKHWIQVELSQYNGLLTWRMNGQVVAQRQNTSAFTSGLPMIGYMDPFASIASPATENYLIVDNVRVYAIIDPPVITAQPVSVTNAPGTTANFGVTVAGTSPVYQWQKNGVNLANGGIVSGATTATLTLTGVTPFDGANYRCVVTNVSGAVTSSVAVLSITGPPVVTAQSTDSTNGAGTAVNFSVTVSGTTPLSYQWQRSLVNLTDGGNVTGSANATLTLSNLSQADAAGYRCIITNALGSATSSVAMLTVIDQPIFVLQPQNQVASQTGAGIIFTSTVTGTAPLGYQWYFQGAAIAGATNTSYVIGNVQTANIGYYNLVVTNFAGGAASTNATLQIVSVFLADTLDADTSANWFVASNQLDTRATWGFDYSLRVDHSGPGVPQNPYYTNSTKALKLEANISSGTVINAISVSPKSINITGDFQIRFDAWQNWTGPAPSGGTGSTESITAGICHPGNIVEVPQTTLNGGVFIAADGDGGVAGNNVTAPDYGMYTNLNVSGSAQLISTNTGNYVALVSGAAGAPTSRANNYYTNITGLAALTIPATEVSSTLPNAANQNGTVRVGSFGFKWHEVILRKSGSGTGTTNISWYIDGFRIASVTNVYLPTTGTNVSLGYFDAFASIAVTNFEFGLFSNFRVENLNGAIATPAILSQPVSVTNYVGTTATFIVGATSPSTLRYQWQKNGNNLSNGGTISGATGATLTITGVQAGDAAVYSCLVLNDSSFSVSTNVNLTVLNVPVIAPLSQAVIEGQSAGFTATALGATGYRWQRNLVNLSNGGVVSGATSDTLTLTGATTNNAGSYTEVITTPGGVITNGPAILLVVPRPTVAVSFNEDDGVILSANAVTNVTYVVEMTGNLVPPVQWTPIATNVVPGGGVIMFSNSIPDPQPDQQYYRIRFP